MASRFLLICLLALTACSNAPPEKAADLPAPSASRTLKTDIPNDAWVKIYFGEVEGAGSDGIDQAAARHGFSKLSDTLLPENDVEARVWVGFGKYRNDGVILRRSAGAWSAVNLRGMSCHLENKGRFDLNEPKSGWPELWRRLTETGILTLPDSSALEYRNNLIDGKSYVVETNAGDLYRTYQYSSPDRFANPKYGKLREVRQMMEIGQTIADEFGLESFSPLTGGCGEK